MPQRGPTWIENAEVSEQLAESIQWAVGLSRRRSRVRVSSLPPLKRNESKCLAVCAEALFFEHNGLCSRFARMIPDRGYCRVFFCSPRQPYLSFPIIKSHAVDSPQQILVTERDVPTWDILLPECMPHDRLCNPRVHSASHGIGLPAVPEIMNSGHRVQLKAFQSLSLGLLQRIIMRRARFRLKEDSAGK